MVLEVLDGGVAAGKEYGFVPRVFPTDEERRHSIRAPNLEHLPIAIRLA
jgi:hypothetical protein